MNINTIQKTVTIKEVLSWGANGHAIMVDKYDRVYVNQCYKGKLV